MIKELIALFILACVMAYLAYPEVYCWYQYKYVHMQPKTIDQCFSEVLPYTDIPYRNDAQKYD